ncbi:MAG TPA: molybdopterin-dependent oxidoreductase [Candidatus Limnocylindrales bacterium]|nr:molybdopterin-dependent oxidoreductase [Candidatus Limnocylindrales bacterium]
MELGFPLAVRLTHFFNILFLSLLIRSGIEILGAHPMLYWRDDCRPGSEWVRFTRKRMPSGGLWTAEDEKQPYSPLVALPGRDHLGLGRYWHFLALGGWIVTGLLYVVLLFTSAEWQRLVPTSWDIFPRAASAALDYLQFHLPPEGNPYNALQQLTYFAVVFVLSPLQIATGLAMSPAVAGRFPWFPALFGGRQAARSLHFIGLLAFVVFTVHHTALVVAHGLTAGLAAIVLGVTSDPTPTETALAVALTILGLAAIVAIHIWATHDSLADPRRMQDRLQRVVDPPQRLLLQPLVSRQAYSPRAITEIPRPNGRPPHDSTWQQLAENDFRGFVFEVSGLVEEPFGVSLDELRGLGAVTQVTKHNCIQGWSQVASWTGVPLGTLLDRARPLPGARYLLFRTFDDKWEHAGDHGYFYETVDLALARHPQSILAWGMNGAPLSAPFGAPLRLRLESQLGYKMVKWVRSAELIADYRTIGEGKGGWRADVLHYSQIAPI